MIWNCVEERVTIERDNGAQYGRMVRKRVEYVLELIELSGFPTRTNLLRTEFVRY